MTFDAYKPCFCGSGKKLKFCCQRLVPTVEQIEQQLQTKQPVAALRTVEDAIARETPPVSTGLLLNRAQILLQLDRFDGALADVQAVLDRQSDNLPALRLRFGASAERGAVEEAVLALQACFELENNPAGLRLLAVMAGGLSARLFQAGHFLAAAKHVLMALAVAPEEATFQQMFLRFMSTGVPPSLKMDRPLKSLPLDAPEPWAAAFREAGRLADLGRFRQAAAAFERLTADVADRKEPWYNLGLCRAWLAQPEPAAQALHRYAEVGEPGDAAVNVETLAQLLAPQARGTPVALVEVDYPINDLHSLTAALGTHARLRRVELPPLQTEPDSANRPSAVFHVLQQPHILGPEGQGSDRLQEVLAYVELYAAQGDDPAEAVLMGTDDGRLQEAESLLAETGGDSLGPPGERVAHHRTSVEAALFQQAFVLPQDADRKRVAALLRLQKQRMALDVWPNLPQSRFDGKAPVEACGDPRQHVRLAGAISVMEQTAEAGGLELDFDGLRRRLGLPLPGAFSPDGQEPENWPLEQLHRMPAADLSDDRLLQLYQLAGVYALPRAERLAAEELIRRPQLKDKVNFVETFGDLAGCASFFGDREAALEWLTRAHAFGAEHLGRDDYADWDLQELALRLAEPQDNRWVALLEHVWQTHRQEPGVRDHVLSMLVELGLLRPGQTLAEPPSETEPPRIIVPSGPSPGGLWTPGQPASAERPKLWTPDQT